MDHLIYAEASAEEQRAQFVRIITSDPFVAPVLDTAWQLDLPDWWLVSGLLYNTVWNSLTARPPGHGIKDADLFYYDATDLSYEAEDRIIAAAQPLTAHLPLPVEIRNQARVHLWFEKKFGAPYTPLNSACDGLSRFATKAHAVGIRKRPDGTIDVHAPFGLEDIFAFRVTPNIVLDNARTHMSKGLRAKSLWPEIELVPWPGI